MSQISHAEYLSHFYVLLIAAKCGAHGEHAKATYSAKKKKKLVEAVPFKGGDHSSAAQARQVQPDMATMVNQRSCCIFSVWEGLKFEEPQT